MPPYSSPDEIKKRLGTDVVTVEEKAFDEMISAVDDEAVRVEADRWTKNAKEIIEVSEKLVHGYRTQNVASWDMVLTFCIN